MIFLIIRSSVKYEIDIILEHFPYGEVFIIGIFIIFLKVINVKNEWIFKTLKNNITYNDKYQIYKNEKQGCANCTDMVGLYSENPLSGYCINHAVTEVFKLDFSLPIEFTAHKYALQSLINLQDGCYWSYPISWNIYYGDSFDDLKILVSETNNQILSNRGESFSFDVKPFRAKVIRFEIVKSDVNNRYFGLSRLDFFGNIGTFNDYCPSNFCINPGNLKSMIFTAYIIIII